MPQKFSISRRVLRQVGLERKLHPSCASWGLSHSSKQRAVSGIGDRPITPSSRNDKLIIRSLTLLLQRETQMPKMMVDPFEVRMRFTTQLQHLSASVTSSQKAAHYALKYRDLDEDLHSCILEQLERVSLPQ
jgi:CTD kinase subunit gamma CTK3